MKTEAILLALVGLISIVGTSPTTTVRARDAAVVAGGGSSNANQTTGQYSRLQHLQAYCSEIAVDVGCAAYRDMLVVANKNNVPAVEQTISEDLARTLSQSEEDEFCGELSKTLKHLPTSLAAGTLEPFGSLRACVKSCYVNDKELKEVCRALLAGYKQIQQTIGKEQSKPLHQMMQAPDGENVEGTKKRPGFEKIVPAVARVNGSADEEIKHKPTLVLGSETEKSAPKKNVADERVNPLAVANAPFDDGTVAKKKPEEEAKDIAPAKVDPTAPKVVEKPSKDSIPVAPVVPKGDGDFEQEQQGAMDGVIVDPFDEDPKQTSDQDGKDGTPSIVNNLEDTDDSAEDTNVVRDEEDDDAEFMEDNQPARKLKLQDKDKLEQVFPDSSKASDIVPGVDPFYEQKDSNFFSYFLFAMFSCAMLYVAYHNKSKLLALVVEGRRTSSGRGGFSKGRKHTAAYRKLDSNLEEAITSGSGSGGHSSSQIIY